MPLLFLAKPLLLLDRCRTLPNGADDVAKFGVPKDLSPAAPDASWSLIDGRPVELFVLRVPLCCCGGEPPPEPLAEVAAAEYRLKEAMRLVGHVYHIMGGSASAAESWTVCQESRGVLCCCCDQCCAES